MILFALTAVAAPWRPFQQVGLELGEQQVETAVLGDWGGAARVIVGGPSGMGIYTLDAEARVQLPLPSADLELVDLDGDGSNELLVCGSQGLTVLRGQPDAVRDVQLVDQPCEQLAVGRAGAVSILMMRDGDTVYQLRPDQGGLKVEPIDELPPVRSIAMAGDTLAALTEDALVTRGGGRHESLPIPADVVGVTRDAGGWALAVAGPSPHLLRSNGVRVELPHAPLALERARLGKQEIFASLDGPAFVGGFRPLEVHALDGRALAAGDASGDGCGDVLVLTEGSVPALVIGDCSTPPPAPTVASAAPAPDRSSPDELALGASWSVVEAQVGLPLELRVSDAVDGDNRFRLVSGPEGMVLRSDGVLAFTPRASQIGLWRASIQVGERFTGVVVKVLDPNAGRVVEAPPPKTREVDPKYRNNVRRSASSTRSFFGFRECMVGAGAAGGASRNSRGTWSNVGLPDVLPSGSPAILMSCTGGSKSVRWIFGVDSAPAFFYIAPSRRMNHVLAGTFGLEVHTPSFRIGPVVNAGLLIFGFGLRAQITPFTTKRGSRHGLEIRAITFPVTPSIQGILTYNVAFGDF